METSLFFHHSSFRKSKLFFFLKKEQFLQTMLLLRGKNPKSTSLSHVKEII